VVYTRDCWHTPLVLTPELSKPTWITQIVSARQTGIARQTKAGQQAKWSLRPDLKRPRVQLTSGPVPGSVPKRQTTAVPAAYLKECPLWTRTSTVSTAEVETATRQTESTGEVEPETPSRHHQLVEQLGVRSLNAPATPTPQNLPSALNEAGSAAREQRTLWRADTRAPD
jgi:hypothetical protein